MPDRVKQEMKTKRGETSNTLQNAQQDSESTRVQTPGDVFSEETTKEEQAGNVTREMRDGNTTTVEHPEVIVRSVEKPGGSIVLGVWKSVRVIFAGASSISKFRFIDSSGSG